MNVSILGSGVFGISIANLIKENGCNVTLYSHSQDINKINVPNGVIITNDIKKAASSEVIIIVSKSESFEEILNLLKPYYNDSLLIIGSKGLCHNKILYDILLNMFDENKIGILSGPTFAMDVKSLEPVGFTYASKNKNSLKIVKKIFNKSSIEYTNDTLGVSYLSILKNVYSIGSGILEGMEYGVSTRTLYLCKCVSEIKEVFKKEKLSIKTIYTYAGIGDLFQTASSSNSRNYTLGVFIGLGNKDAANNFTKKNTIEGLSTLKYFYSLFKDKNINLPIFNTIYNMVILDAKKEDLINLLV